jgi:hypothetical protein
VLFYKVKKKKEFLLIFEAIFPIPASKKKNLFDGVLYQYFDGLYYKRYHKRDITISITILFLRGKRENKNNKTDILRVRSKRNITFIKKIFVL